MSAEKMRASLQTIVTKYDATDFGLPLCESDSDNASEFLEWLSVHVREALASQAAQPAQCPATNKGHIGTLCSVCQNVKEDCPLMFPKGPPSQAAPDSDALTIAYMAGAAKGRQAVADPNAPWLSEAHALCGDAGIPPGHIGGRIRALRDKLDRRPEAVAWMYKPSAVLRGEVLTSDPELAQIARDSGIAVQALYPDQRERAAPDAATKDAARYRWLRNPTQRVDSVLDKQADHGTWEYRSGSELDEAIDAAMLAASPEPEVKP